MIYTNQNLKVCLAAPLEIFTQWRANASVTADGARRVYYPADTFGGQSGAPVWRDHPNFGVSGMAIHAYGTGNSGISANNNHGTRITKYIHQLFKAVIAVK